MSAEAERAAFAGLIDYAGLFPPAGLAMAPAIDAFERARGSEVAWVVDRFVVPASRLAEFAETYRGMAPLPVSIILDAGDDATLWFDRARAAIAQMQSLLARDARIVAGGLEVPLPPLKRLRDSYDAPVGQFAGIVAAAGLRAVPAYVEIVRDGRWAELLPGTSRVLARYGFGAKVRCGGVAAAAFPTCEELAAFVVAAAEAGIPFKATAGLHHPVRRVDPVTGTPMHGFLGLLAAALVARHENDPLAVEAALGEEDADAFRFSDGTFAWRDRSYDAAQIAATRACGFVGYGSCSIAEPVDDLRALGFLPGAAA